MIDDFWEDDACDAEVAIFVIFGEILVHMMRFRDFLEDFVPDEAEIAVL